MMSQKALCKTRMPTKQEQEALNFYFEYNRKHKPEPYHQGGTLAFHPFLKRQLMTTYYCYHWVLGACQMKAAVFSTGVIKLFSSHHTPRYFVRSERGWMVQIEMGECER